MIYRGAFHMRPILGLVGAASDRPYSKKIAAITAAYP